MENKEMGSAQIKILTRCIQYVYVVCMFYTFRNNVKALTWMELPVKSKSDKSSAHRQKGESRVSASSWFPVQNIYNTIKKNSTAKKKKVCKSIFTYPQFFMPYITFSVSLSLTLSLLESVKHSSCAH